MKLLAVIKDESKNGLYNIKIRVTANRKVGYIKTEYYCFKDDFDSKNGFLKVRDPKKGELETPEMQSKRITHNNQNSKIRELLASYNRKYAQLVDQDHDINWLIDYFKDTAGEELNLLTYYEGFIKDLKKQKRNAYAESHSTAKSRIEKFSGKSTLFKSVNYSYLESFENWLRKQECSVNTIAIYMRNLRAVFNDAIKKDKIELGLYPFRRYEISRRLKPVIKKRNLSAKVIRKIKNANLTDDSEIMARDIFMLSFYLIGINLKDLFNLGEIKDGRIQYYRAKTKRYYDVKVFPQALKLIKKHKGKKNLLIFKELYSDYRNLNKVVNAKLKSISESDALKLNIPPTTYYARHSWATIASQLDIQRDVIKHALGHGTNTVTDVYIDFDLGKVDKANELVIKSIL